MEAEAGSSASWSGTLQWKDTDSCQLHQVDIQLLLGQAFKAVTSSVFDSWPKELQVQLTSKKTIDSITPHIGSFYTADLRSQAGVSLDLLTSELSSGKVGLALFTCGTKSGVCLAVTISGQVLKGIICVWEFQTESHRTKYSLCIAGLVHEIHLDLSALLLPLNKTATADMYFSNQPIGHRASNGKESILGRYYTPKRRWDQPFSSRQYQEDGGGSRFNQTVNTSQPYPRPNNQPVQANRPSQSPAGQFSNVRSQPETSVKWAGSSDTRYDPKRDAQKVINPVRQSNNPIRETHNPVRQSRSPVRQSRSPVRQSRSPVRQPRSPVRPSRSPVRPSHSTVKQSNSSAGRSRSPIKQTHSPRGRSRSPLGRSRSPLNSNEPLSWRAGRKEHQRSEQSQSLPKPDLQRPPTQPISPSVIVNGTVSSTPSARPNTQNVNNSPSKPRRISHSAQINKEKVVADTTQGERELAFTSNQSVQSPPNNSLSQQIKSRQRGVKIKHDVTMFKIEQSRVVEAKPKPSATVTSGQQSCQDSIPHSSQDLPSTTSNITSTTQQIKNEQALELEGYLLSLQDLLRCYKCKLWVVPEIVFCCLCSVSCMKCAKEVPNCPGCEAPISQDFKCSLLYYRLSSVIPHPCPNEGCDTIVKPEDNHAANCKYKPFMCFICQIPVPQVSALEHFQEVHPQHMLLQEGMNENVQATQFWQDSKSGNKTICSFVQERFVTITLYKFEDEQQDAQFVIEKNSDDNNKNVTITFAFKKNGWDCCRISPFKKGLKTWVEVPLDIVRDWLFGECKLDIKVVMKEKRKVVRNANKVKKSKKDSDASEEPDNE